MARNGFALGMRKSDGKLGAVVVVLPYNEGIPNDLSSGLEILKALRATGMPPSKQLLIWQEFCVLFFDEEILFDKFEWAEFKSLKLRLTFG